MKKEIYTVGPEAKKMTSEEAIQHSMSLDQNADREDYKEVDGVIYYQDLWLYKSDRVMGW